MKRAIIALGLVSWGTMASQAAALINNDLSGALPLSGFNILAKGTNTAATKEPGEPDHAGNAGGKSLWWRWTPSVSQTVFIDTVNSTFPTLLAVYTGTVVSNLTLVASNPDGADLLNRLSFQAQAGTPYRIAVDGRDGASGVIFLNIRTAPPANDRFDQRAALTGTNVTVTVSNDGAMLEPGEPAHTPAQDFPPRSSVWWTWTAPFDGMVTVDTRGSSFDTFLAIYAGSTLETLSPVR